MPSSEWEREEYLDALGAAAREEDEDWDRRLVAGLAGQDREAPRRAVHEQLDMYDSVVGETGEARRRRRRRRRRCHAEGLRGGSQSVVASHPPPSSDESLCWHGLPGPPVQFSRRFEVGAQKVRRKAANG